MPALCSEAPVSVGRAGRPWPWRCGRGPFPSSGMRVLTLLSGPPLTPFAARGAERQGEVTDVCTVGPEWKRCLLFRDHRCHTQVCASTTCSPCLSTLPGEVDVFGKGRALGDRPRAAGLQERLCSGACEGETPILCPLLHGGPGLSHTAGTPHRRGSDTLYDSHAERFLAHTSQI